MLRENVILFVSGLFAPASGGAELSMQTALRYLARKGFRIHVLTGQAAYDSLTNTVDNENITITRIPTVESFNSTFASLIESNPQIIAVITQNLWSDLAIIAAKRHKLPIIYFARNPFGYLDLSPGSPYECDFVIANSGATKEYVASRNSLENIEIIPPLVDYQQYLIKTSSRRRFITIVNPIEIKGGGIFKEVAKMMPENEFLAVRGWHHLRTGGQWNVSLLSELATSFRAPLYVPLETDFTGQRNITLRETVEDMRTIYCETRILLLPSTETESEPRVVYEAMINGIPVIGSALGGIPAAIGDGGLLVKNRSAISEWVAAIGKLDDESFYSECSRRAVLRAQEESIDKNIMPLIKILNRLIREDNSNDKDLTFQLFD